jgi:hypothetical protein
MFICLPFLCMCRDIHSIPNLCSGSVMESYYSAQDACRLSKCVTCCVVTGTFFFAHSDVYDISLKSVTLFCMNEWHSGQHESDHSPQSSPQLL